MEPPAIDSRDYKALVKQITIAKMSGITTPYSKINRLLLSSISFQE